MKMKRKIAIIVAAGAASFLLAMLFPPVYFIDDQNNPVSTTQYIFCLQIVSGYFETALDIQRLFIEFAAILTAATAAVVSVLIDYGVERKCAAS